MRLQLEYSEDAQHLQAEDKHRLQKKSPNELFIVPL